MILGCRGSGKVLGWWEGGAPGAPYILVDRNASSLAWSAAVSEKDGCILTAEKLRCSALRPLRKISRCTQMLSI